MFVTGVQTCALPIYELRPCGSTVFCIDYRQAGIGSASCGPMLLEKYQLKETEISFDVRLKPELL